MPRRDYGRHVPGRPAKPRTTVPHPRRLGFTLIELTVVLAIIAIIVAIAYPSYIDTVRKARLTDAQTVLLEASHWMEKKYVEENSYPVADFDDSSGLDKSPKDSSKTYYEITAVARTGSTGYRLIATPKSGQQWKDCARLTIDDLGDKAALKEDGETQSEADCWP